MKSFWKPFSWVNVLRLVLAGSAALALLMFAANAFAQDIDVSQVKGLPAQIQSLVNQINALAARLETQIVTIQTTPGPAGVAGATGATGPAGPAGPAGADGAGADPAALLVLQNAVSTLVQEQQAYQITDANGAVVGRFVGQPAVDVVTVAARITVLVPPLGATTQTLDGLYVVTPNTISIATPLNPLVALPSDMLFTDSDCMGARAVASNFIASGILYDPAPPQRVYTVGPLVTEFELRSRRNGAQCANEPRNFVPARPLTPTSVTGILDRAASLNPQFSPPFDVEALYLP